MEHSKEHRQMQQMIKQFDENLSLKSNKKDIWKIENDLQEYATKKMFQEFEDKAEDELLTMSQEIESQKDSIDTL